MKPHQLILAQSLSMLAIRVTFCFHIEQQTSNNVKCKSCPSDTLHKPQFKLHSEQYQSSLNLKIVPEKC